MHKRAVLFVLIAFPAILSAQYGYFSFGYNGNLLKSENLDFVVDRYNETRDYLDETMSYPHYLDGFDLHFGGGEILLIDIGFSWRSSKVSAAGTDLTGIQQQRDLKYKFGCLDFGLGVNMIDKDVKIGIGYNQTIGSEKIDTRIAASGDVDDKEYTTIFKAFNPGGDVFVQFVFVVSESSAFILKPYYNISYLNTNYAELNQNLNPVTAPFDDPFLESKLNGFGASLMLAFGSF